MNWREMTTVQKIIAVVGQICGILFFVLLTIDLFDLVTIPRVTTYPLFTAYLASLGFTLKDKKLAKGYYIMAAGYILLALLHLFFR